MLEESELLPRGQEGLRACQYASLPPKRALRFPFVEDIAQNHYEDFKAGYDEHCEKHYGFFRSVVDEVVEEYFA